MRYVLEFITIILPRPTKFCQYFILLIENFNLYSDEDGVKHIRIKARPNKWHENDCPFCHKSCPAYDKHSSRPTTWRGLDWGGILVEVEYQTHRIICLEHGVLACADSVLIPVQAAYLPVKGLQQLIKTIGRVKKQLYPKLKIGRIHAFPNHPFKVLDDEKMDTLVDSIRENGILNPVIVRPDRSGNYEMISGHRRLHVAKIVGLKKVPAIVKEMSDDEAMTDLLGRGFLQSVCCWYGRWK